MKKIVIIAALLLGACRHSTTLQAQTTTATVTPVPNLPFYDSSTGVTLPCVGCNVYTYAAGTTTPVATYTDSTGTTTNTNPIVLNSAGYAPSGIWLKLGCYKYVLKTSAFVTIYTTDNICTGSLIALATVIDGTTSTPLLTITQHGTGKALSASGGVVLNGLTYPATDGTAGWVLKTDGAGHLNFAAGSATTLPVVFSGSSVGALVTITQTNFAGFGLDVTYGGISTTTLSASGQISASGAVTGARFARGGHTFVDIGGYRTMNPAATNYIIDTSDNATFNNLISTGVTSTKNLVATVTGALQTAIYGTTDGAGASGVTGNNSGGGAGAGVSGTTNGTGSGMFASNSGAGPGLTAENTGAGLAALIDGPAEFTGTTLHTGAATFSTTATFNGALAGTHAQSIGVGDTPTLAGLIVGPVAATSVSSSGGVNASGVVGSLTSVNSPSFIAGGSAGITGATCSSFKAGICIAP